MSNEDLSGEPDRVVEAVRSGAGFTCVLRGAPASGKSTALRRIAHRAGDVRVLWAVGSPDEVDQPFALLEQLSDDLRGDEVEPVRRQLRSFLDSRQPVLLLVDDAHWIDPASAQVLGHTARRVQGRRIGVVFAASTAHPLPEALAGLPDLELPPLGLDEARALLTRPSLSSADIPDGVVAELLQRCAGNPLVLREFAEFLDDNQLCGRQPLPRQLVLGPRSLEVFRRSWAALPERCRRWLLLLSLGPDSFPVCLWAAQRLDLELADLAPAERAGVVRAADVPRWSSPLERVAVQQSATREETALVCAALAEAVDAAEWPVEHARYLAGALTDPDRAATALAAAAVPMAQTGQLLDAYEAAQQAAALSTDTAKRERYRIVTAELAWLAGYSDHALDLLDRAAPQRSADARTSATIIRAVIRGFTDSWTSGWRLLPEEVHHEPGSAEHAFRLLVTAITAGWENASVPALQQAVARLRSTVAPPLELSPGVMAALERVVAGHSDLDREERRALRALAWWARPSDALHPKAWPPPLLPMFLGEEERYAELFAELLRSEPVQAAHSTRALLLLKLSSAQLAVGQWDRALDNAGKGARLADELGHHALRQQTTLCSAWIHAARGDQEEYARCADAAARHPGQLPPTMRWVRGLAALSASRPAEALDWLRGLHHGTSTPHLVTLRRMSTADLVEAAVQANRADEVADVVADFAAWVAGGAARWARFDLARCHALLDPDEAERWFAEALELGTNRLWSSARLELQFGSWLRRRKRYQEAREHLRIAEELFHRLGATAWHQRAHAELRAAGETQRAEPHDDLTPQEHRIALLAAEGLSNRQIAERLALSPRTVGYHLYKIFPKLDITSRAQLASALQRASTRNRGSG